jgi:hypothetical protein
VERATSRGALDSLSYFVHGDATDMEMTSSLRKGAASELDISVLDTKPLTGIGSFGMAEVAMR